MKDFSKYIVIGVIPGLFFVFSCISHTNNNAEDRILKGYNIALDSIIGSGKGIIRGIELGESRNNIKKNEQNTPIETDESYTYYEYKVDSTIGYSIAYNFSNDTLDEIEMQITCKSLDVGTLILMDLKNYYQKKYTAPIMDKGIYVYNCFDSHKRNFTLTLSDNSGVENSIINILVYKEK